MNPKLVRLSPLYRALRPKLEALGRRKEVLKALEEVVSHKSKMGFGVHLQEEYIDSAFYWEESPQGHAYWSALHTAIFTK